MKAEVVAFRALILQRKFFEALEFALRQAEISSSAATRLDWIVYAAQCYVALDEYAHGAALLDKELKAHRDLCAEACVKALVLMCAIHAFLGFYEDAQRYLSDAVAMERKLLLGITGSGAFKQQKEDGVVGWGMYPLLYSGFVSRSLREADFLGSEPGFLVSVVQAEAGRRRMLCEN